MPIASRTPHAPREHAAPPDLEEVKLVKDKEIYNTATINEMVDAPSSLMVYMEGMAWSVDYYSQLLGKSDDIREVDIGQNPALQQYQKIHDLELRVQNELSSSWDEDNSLMTVTGTAVIVQVIPNQHDYFVTDAGTKGKGLFKITSVERKTYNNEAVYEINYVLLGYLDHHDIKARYEGIIARVVREYYFVKDRITAGLSPLLTKKEHGDSIDLRKSYMSLARSYQLFFYGQADRIFLFPDTEERIFDPRLVGFLRYSVDPKDMDALNQMHAPSMDRDEYLAMPSIWTAIEQQDVSIIQNTMPLFKMAARAHFKTNSWMMSTMLWQVSQYVYPYPDESHQWWNLKGHQSHEKHGYFSPYVRNPEVFSLRDDIETIPDNLIWNTTKVAGDDILIFKNTCRDEYYVLSEDFYKQTDNLSLLEIVVRDYIERKPISLEQVKILVQRYGYLPMLEKFYYGPIILFMIRNVVRGFY